MIFPIAFVSGSGGGGGGGTITEPVYSPQGGTYAQDNPLPVLIRIIQPATSFRYTTNGTVPSLTIGTLVNATNTTVLIPANIDTTLQAIAIGPGNIVSSVESDLYSISPP